MTTAKNRIVCIDLSMNSRCDRRTIFLPTSSRKKPELKRVFLILFQIEIKAPKKVAVRLIRIEFLLVLPFVLDQGRVILAVIWILLFVNRVNPAPVFLIAVGMIHLDFTCL